MPATPDVSYAFAFTADAFLVPRHATKDALFQLAADDDALQKLMPSPETVRDAILECKKQGIAAAFSSGLALRISGDALALMRCFGVRLASSSSEPASAEYFEDDAGKAQSRVSPIKGHPLEKFIVSIAVAGSANLDIPGFRTAPRPQAKTLPHYIWPDELAGRLSVKPALVLNKPVTLQEAAEYRLELTHTPGCCVAVVDTGLAYKHTYLSEFKTSGRFIWPPNDRNAPSQLRVALNKLAANKVAMFDKALDSMRLLEVLSANATSLYKALFSSFRLVGGQKMPPASTEVCDALSSVVRQIRGSQWCGLYIVSVQSNRLDQFLIAVGISLRQNTPLTIADEDLTTVQRFETFVREKLSTLVLALSWIEHHDDEGEDLVGHGTGMAASVLGVAGNSYIASFPGLSENGVRAYKELVGEPPSVIADALEAAVVFSHHKDTATRVLKLNQPLTAPTCYKVVSNSFGSDMNRKEGPARLNHFRQKMKEWAGRMDVAMLFSAGNSFPVNTVPPGQPPTSPDTISFYALLGEYGAIIVGGAWDYDRTLANPNQNIYLSTAAHGDEVKVDGTTFTFPDICGFVGPELPDETSPYVYIPWTAPNVWNYGGGGTSSACAQVAGLCGAIRAKYPDLNVLQIKAAIVEGGDRLSGGRSYQNKTPDQIGNPKLANVIGAFHRAKVKASTLHK